MNFGQWLRKKRTEKNIRIQQVAEFCGTSGSQVSEIETGKNTKFNMELAEKLANSVGVKLSTALRQIGK